MKMKKYIFVFTYKRIEKGLIREKRLTSLGSSKEVAIFNASYMLRDYLEGEGIYHYYVIKIKEVKEGE